MTFLKIHNVNVRCNVLNNNCVRLLSVGGLSVEVVDVITKTHLLEMLAYCWLNEVVGAELAGGVVVAAYT